MISLKRPNEVVDFYKSQISAKRNPVFFSLRLAEFYIHGLNNFDEAMKIFNDLILNASDKSDVLEKYVEIIENQIKAFQDKGDKEGANNLKNKTLIVLRENFNSSKELKIGKIYSQFAIKQGTEEEMEDAVYSYIDMFGDKYAKFLEEKHYLSELNQDSPEVSTFLHSFEEVVRWGLLWSYGKSNNVDKGIKLLEKMKSIAKDYFTEYAMLIWLYERKEDYERALVLSEEVKNNKNERTSLRGQIKDQIIYLKLLKDKKTGWVKVDDSGLMYAISPSEYRTLYVKNDNGVHTYIRWEYGAAYDNTKKGTGGFTYEILWKHQRSVSINNESLPEELREALPDKEKVQVN